MACLGAVLYDPASVATKALSSLAAMTAFDTTNARITFTAPANGDVCQDPGRCQGSTIAGATLLGVLDGSTVRGRQSPFIESRSGTSGAAKGNEAVFLVTGLTPSSSYTFDAAYGVETLLASTLYGWGGPDDTTTINAYGALSFEVWETTNLLAGVDYDPTSSVSKSGASLSVMAAMDTTNLRLSVTPPASGQVFVRLRGTLHGATTMPGIFLGVLEGSTIRMRCAPFHNSLNAATGNATTCTPARPRRSSPV